ncbi:hypothetical protein [Erythrobacter sp. Alg231-14]|uniref:hypothetical protein n=1 Tax=Erythrobacter sp. Alg231-14 TaxID=1922225 RepID=UPI000D5592B3
MKRLLGSTLVLLIITFASKLIGFVRELILLESLGIGAELDAFVVLYGLVNLLSGALGICIVTSLTPIAGVYRTRGDTLGLLKEGAGVGVVVCAAALIATLVYTAIAGFGNEALSPVWPIALIVPLVVPFALIAEYQVALFLSRNQRAPVIAGNLLLSLPLVAALLLFDLGIVAYAVGLVATFALRASVFTGLLLRGAEPDVGDAPRGKTALFSDRLWRTMAGGSAMLAVAAIAVTAQMAARELAEGQATIIAYGLKVPQFIITSIWFVFGTAFFADLVTRGTLGMKHRIAVYCAVNAALALTVFGAVLMAQSSPQMIGLTDQSQMVRVIIVSAPFLPLIVLTPLVEMTQRLLVTCDRHRWVIGVTGAVLIAGFAAQAMAVWTQSVAMLAWSPAVGGAAGGAVCLALLLFHPIARERAGAFTEKTLSHASS